MTRSLHSIFLVFPWQGISENLQFMLHLEYGSRIQLGTRRAGSDGSMSASGSAGPGFEPRWGSFENFQPRG